MFKGILVISSTWQQRINPLHSSQTSTQPDKFPPMADAASSAAAAAKLKATSLIDKAKDKIDAVLHYTGETHGKQEDIDEKMALDDVKAPNVFERVKGEIQALAKTVSAKSDEITGEVKDKFHAIAGDAKGDEKTSEPVKIKEGSPLVHDKKTHGTSNDINEDTPIDAVKAPNVFQRAKEEVEALVQTIHPKKEPSPNIEEGGFRSFIAKLLQKVCHPWDPKKDGSKSD